jgi:7-cyano-7-deazaguanine synthase
MVTLPPVTDGVASVGLLLSGGVDSAVLMNHLLGQGWLVQPFYVQAGCVWEAAELRAVHQLMKAAAQPTLSPLVVLQMPVDDLYASHWSTTGQQAPDHHSPDEAVFLPGRNPLLLLKPALWCQMHGVPWLAIATLVGNPFGDARPCFFKSFEAMLNQATGTQVHVLRPFEGLTKRQVLEIGRGFPMELTFSCLAPREGRHCGRCNKCAERAAALRYLETGDPTCYSEDLATLAPSP